MQDVFANKLPWSGHPLPVTAPDGSHRAALIACDGSFPSGGRLAARTVTGRERTLLPFPMPEVRSI